jgi:hypothetical protein
MTRTRNAFALLLALAALFATAGPAVAAGLEITEFETFTTSTEAGDHPDLQTKFKFAGAGDPEIAKNISFELPKGIYGNPSVLSQCSTVNFALNLCPPGAQVGFVILHANYENDPNYLLGYAPIYSVEPGAGEAARFAFTAPTLDIPIVIPVRVLSADDYRLQFTFEGATQLAPLAAADFTFWGFPAAESHNFFRFGLGSPDKPQNCPGVEFPICENHTAYPPAGRPVKPFTGNPSVCDVPMPAILRVETYQSPGETIEATTKYPETTNCARQTFKPLAQAKLTTTAADSASGIDLIVKAGQVQSGAAAPSQVRDVVLELAEGLTINPDAADGQTACTDGEARIGIEAPDACPDSSKIGTIDISSAALPGNLEGAIYFGEPKAGSQYRLLIAADGYGIHTKFLGDLLPDPKTGRIKAVFKDLPQLPFDEYGIHLFASDRGVLATPTRCGIHVTETDLFPWNNQLADRKAQFSVSIDTGPGGGLCPGEKRPFNPRLEAGTSNSQAGGFSDFHLKLDRDDGDQFLGDLTFTMPPGLTASLRGLTYCPESAIAAAAQRAGRAEQSAPSCPPSSHLGTTNVAAGPGSHPFHAVGDIYLAGPFKGAPLSLVAITPALAGPYDYGVVVVRVAIQVDPLDAHVFAASDTVPAIIGGVPIRMRSIQVNLDKPNFMINPTNCAPMSVGSQGIGDQGALTSFSSYFQAINCGNLPFKPKFSVRVIGRRGLRRSANPALRFELRTRPGDANIKSIAVTLPHAYEIDQTHLGNICTEKELLLTECEGRQAIGSASTVTPLLDQPLSGLVYAVSGGGGLPRLAFLLNGQVKLVPRAESSSVGYGLRTTVPVVPDAPVGHFVLNLFGGSRGYLLNTRNVCGRAPAIKVAYTAQNGASYTQKVKVKRSCSAPKGKRVKR